ncbi:MAG: histidinol-phosphatase [Rhodospirillales bacterium]|nr:histidinol-phosphatase [Rhodospirillales bacterium]
MTVEANLIDLAERLADAAARITMSYFGAHIEAERKVDTSPVTVADRQAEAAMREMIEAEVPDHGIFGEEYGQARTDAEYVWVLDPIDGTKSFVIGKPLFGTLIALLRNGKPIIGIIDCPALKERWLGVEGRPSTRNGKPIETRACENLDEAWMASTSPGMFTGNHATAFAAVKAAARQTVWGGDCHSYGLLASGNLDLVVEANMSPYDHLALVPVIEGAGGKITDWNGGALGLSSDGTVLAAGDGAMHEAAGILLTG